MADDPNVNIDNAELTQGDPPETPETPDTEPQVQVDPEKAKLSRIAETQRKRAQKAEAETAALQAKLDSALKAAESKEELQFEVQRIKLVMSSGLGLDALDLCEGKTEEEVNSKIAKLKSLMPAPPAHTESPAPDAVPAPAAPAPAAPTAPRPPVPIVDTKPDVSRMTPEERKKHFEAAIRNEM